MLTSLDFSAMATKSQKYQMTKYVVKIIHDRNKVSPGSFSISEGFLLSHNFCLLTEDVACASAGPATLLRCSCVTPFWLEAVSTELTRADICRGELEIRVTHHGQLALPAMPPPQASGDAKSARDDPRHNP